MRTDKNGKRLAVMYCSCGGTFTGNGAWSAHRRKKDRTCRALTRDQWEALRAPRCSGWHDDGIADGNLTACSRSGSGCGLVGCPTIGPSC